VVGADKFDPCDYLQVGIIVQTLVQLLLNGVVVMLPHQGRGRQHVPSGSFWIIRVDIFTFTHILGRIALKLHWGCVFVFQTFMGGVLVVESC
jgi:hypothetical protein